jgi:hypothetical protein
MCRRFPLCGLAQEKQLLVFSSCFGRLFRIFRCLGLLSGLLGGFLFGLLCRFCFGLGLLGGSLFFQLGNRRFMGGNFLGVERLLGFVRGQLVSVSEKSDGGFQVVDGPPAGSHLGFVGENQPVDVIESIVGDGPKGTGGAIFKGGLQRRLDAIKIRDAGHVQQGVCLVDVMLEYDRIDVIGAVDRFKGLRSRDAGQGDYHFFAQGGKFAFPDFQGALVLGQIIFKGIGCAGADHQQDQERQSGGNQLDGIVDRV